VNVTQALHEQGQSIWLELAANVQSEGAKSSVAAWNDLVERIDVQSKAVA
jgi:hypothetical protein